jgi:hypothetical protein
VRPVHLSFSLLSSRIVGTFRRMKLARTLLKWIGITIGLAVLSIAGFLVAAWLSPGDPLRSYVMASSALGIAALSWRLVMAITTPASLSFADRVRIKACEETERHGLAGREGQIYGWTTPSTSGVEVIGSGSEDHAVNVHFDDTGETRWFASHLLERIDRGEGTVVSLEGSDFEWVRLADGEWRERPKGP